MKRYKPVMYEGTKGMVMEKLLSQLSKGPSFSTPFIAKSEQQAAIDHYRLWAETWIIPDLKELFTWPK